MRALLTYILLLLYRTESLQSSPASASDRLNSLISRKSLITSKAYLDRATSIV